MALAAMRGSSAMRSSFLQSIATQGHNCVWIYPNRVARSGRALEHPGHPPATEWHSWKVGCRIIRLVRSRHMRRSVRSAGHPDPRRLGMGSRDRGRATRAHLGTAKKNVPTATALEHRVRFGPRVSWVVFRCTLKVTNGDNRVLGGRSTDVAMDFENISLFHLISSRSNAPANLRRACAGGRIDLLAGPAAGSAPGLRRQGS